MKTLQKSLSSMSLPAAAAVLICSGGTAFAQTPVATVQAALGNGTGIYLDGGSDGNTNGGVSSTWTTATPDTWSHNTGTFGEDTSDAALTVDGDVLDAHPSDVENTDASEIQIAVTGLAAGTEYDVYVVHLGRQGNSTPNGFKWGTTSGALTTFSHATSPGTTIAGTTVLLTGVKVGQVTSNGSGGMTLFVDDTNGGAEPARSQIDGILLHVADSDTDGDGLDNVDENSGALNPYDSFGFYVGAGNGGAPTNPLSTDSDLDGIPDNEEIIPGTDGFLTDPNSDDTDLDTLKDKWEIDNSLDPTDDGFTNVVTGDIGNFDNGDFGDPDGDLLDNFGEQSAGTDPQDPDTDNDGLTDNQEVTTYGTNPFLIDTDKDGLSDGAEVNTHSTDPLDRDSDNDTFSDGLEIAEGTNPNGAPNPTGFIGVVNTLTPVTVNNTGITVGADGVLFTSATFDMGVGANAVAFMVTTEGAGTSVVRHATFAGQPMTGVFVNQSVQSAAIYYLINPPTTTGTFQLTLDASFPSTVDYAYSAVSLSGVPGVADTATAASALNTNTVPLELAYSTTTNDGFVLGAAVNNDFLTGGNPTYPISVASGNPDTNLLGHTVVDSSGHLHTYGRTGVAGGHTDGYLGQYQRTAIVTVVFGATPPFADADNDGLNDLDFEDEFFGDNSGTVEPSDLTAARGTQAQNVSMGADHDNDADGANNLQEQTAGTNPTLADTDGDGLSDGAEINTHGTSPLFADSDGDGIGDLEEVTSGTDGFVTNPLSDDTDNDNLKDKWEVDNDLNPTNNTGVNGETGNFDNDGLTNLQEQTIGTHPKNPDTDADGLNDGNEVNGTVNPWVAGSKTGPPGDPTDPLVADSDGDTLSDGAEVNVHGTDPNNTDSDGDTYADSVEVNAGSNPLIAGNIPAGFINTVNTAAAVTVNNTAPTVGADGILFTSASFDMGAGANTVALIVTGEGAGNSTVRSATFAGQTMNMVYVEDSGLGVQTAAIYYLIDPPVTSGTFVLTLDANYASTVDYAYSAVSLSNVASVAGTDTAGSSSSASTTPLVISYSSTSDDGYVLGAAVNNDFLTAALPTHPMSIAYGNPNTDLLVHTVVDSSGHFHTSGRVGPAGSHSDGYLGQYQRTAIASVVFESTTGVVGGFSTWSATNAGNQDPDEDFDLDGVDNGVEYFMGQTGSTFTSKPGIVSGSVTWPKDPAYSGTYLVQTSPNLVTWTNVTGSAVDNGTSVTYAVPSVPGKLFVRLVVDPD